MFERILVPLDGSVRAERAFHVAARLVRLTRGSIVVVRVVPPPVKSWPSSAPLLPSAAVQTFNEAGRIEAANYLTHLVQTSNLAGVETHIEVPVGPVATTLLSVGATHNVDLIILCSHGQTGSPRWGLGSVVEKVTRQAEVPVLVLPDDVRISPDARIYDARPWWGIVPLDGSAVAEAALAPASCLITALSAPAQATLHLLLVVTLPDTAGEREMPVSLDVGMKTCLCQETEGYLKTAIEHFRQTPQADQRVSVTSSLRFGWDVAETVLTAAEQEEAAKSVEGPGIDGGGLIAMTTHGRGGLCPWMMGHVTARVLSATRLPLLLVPPPQAGRGESATTLREPEITSLSR